MIALILGLLCAAAILTYFIPIILVAYILPKQNLKDKYKATWALVTGSSSGIGKALAENLAQQGLNVCLVALDDEVLDKTTKELQANYPACKFVKIGVNLSQNPQEYMQKIDQATASLPINIVMNNAGYLLMGFFVKRDIEDHIRNLECNSIAAVRISHYFLKRIAQQSTGNGGCITFTSSAVHYLPSPFAIMYGASKAMLSHFAQSLAIEAADHKVDVLCVHPSYTATNLYDKNPKLGVLNLLQKFAATPEDVADVTVQSVGHVVIRDTGAYSFFTKMIPKVIDIGFMTSIMIPLRTTLDEYKKFSKQE